MRMHFAAIKRNERYSPNHITNDALILRKTGEEICKLGGQFTIYDEFELNGGGIKEDIIFSMARDSASISKLKRMAQSGKLVINPPDSVLNCYRVNLSRMLSENGICFPKSVIVDTADARPYRLSDITQKNKLWIKRGDVHAIHKEDISLVYYDEQINHLLNEFNRRGIKQALLQEHCEGDDVKFYGVRDTGFFYWYFSDGERRYTFDESALMAAAAKSAEVLGLHIYGGDAVIAKDGGFTIIDFNDWPSFAPIRDEASKIIAKKLCDDTMAFMENRPLRGDRTRASAC